MKSARKMKLVGAFLLTDSQQAREMRQTNITPRLVQYTHMFRCTYLHTHPSWLSITTYLICSVAELVRSRPDPGIFFASPAPAPLNSRLSTSVVDPNTLNLDQDPGFWPNLDPG